MKTAPGSWAEVSGAIGVLVEAGANWVRSGGDVAVAPSGSNGVVPKPTSGVAVAVEWGAERPTIGVWLIGGKLA